MKVQRWAVIRTTFEGLHHWPEAPPYAAYLRDLHRHIFHVEVRVEQWHNERDIEYIQLNHLVKAWCRNFGPGYPQVHSKGTASCETMAQELGEYLSDTYPSRHITTAVFEDGENGAVLNFTPEEKRDAKTIK